MHPTLAAFVQPIQAQVLQNIVQVRRPTTDPAWGATGPLFAHWHGG